MSGPALVVGAYLAMVLAMPVAQPGWLVAAGANGPPSLMPIAIRSSSLQLAAVSPTPPASTVMPSPTATAPDRLTTPPATEVMSLQDYERLLGSALGGAAGRAPLGDAAAKPGMTPASATPTLPSASRPSQQGSEVSAAAARVRLARPVWVRLRSGQIAYVPPLDQSFGRATPKRGSAAGGGRMADGGPASKETPRANGAAAEAANSESRDEAARRSTQFDLIRRQLWLSANDDTTARLGVLQQVLSRPAFRARIDWWDRLIRWLSQRLPEPSDSPAIALGTRLVGLLALLASALALSALFARWLREWWLSMAREAELRRAGTDSELPPTAHEARRQAAALATAGHFREAVRRLYLAALLRLEEADLLTFDRSLTNREVLARLAGRPSLAARLAPIVGTYDEVWYGIHEPNAATFQAYAAEIDRLDASLSGHLEPPRDGRLARADGKVGVG